VAITGHDCVDVIASERERKTCPERWQ
jgi:hypothetical protein